MKRRIIGLALLCALAVICVACGGARGGAGARSEAAVTRFVDAETTETPSLASRMVKLAGLVPAPVFTFDEYELPPGCLIEDYNDEWALCERSTRQEYPPTEYLILDLATGAHRAISWPIVNEKRGWNRLTVRSGSDWIAWEEVSPNESNDLFRAEWRLYAATFDPTTATVGDPIEIDGGNTSYRLRPHFAVCGDEVVWSRSRVTLSPQETAEFSGRVMSRALPGGSDRELYATPDVIRALRVSGSGVVLTTASERAATPQLVMAVDIASRSVAASCTLDPGVQSSHWGDYANGFLTWSWFPTADSTWPSLALQCADGSLWRVDGAAGDGNIVNGYLFYERNRTRGPVGRVVSVREICGVKLDTMARFVMCESEGASWESCIPSNPSASYLVSLDDSAYAQDGGKTVVRRYAIE